MKYLITGGCGFLGSNIASEILNRGLELVIFDNLSRVGSISNLEWLKQIGNFEFINGDIRNVGDVNHLIKTSRPDVVYHLAGQVAMTTSIANPRLDFEVNTLGTFNLADSIRNFSPDTVIIYSSSNKVYGDLEQFTYEESATRYCCVECPKGFDETIGLDFHSPYGVSKGSADQYLLDFSRIYGLNTVVFRHSSMCGSRQYATSDQGWVGWFVQKVLKIKKSKKRERLVISGNGKQVRDLLFASDCVSLYLSVSENIELVSGKAFNIGGGMDNSLSILELFTFLEGELDVQIDYHSGPPRQSDQRVFVADTARIRSLIDWNIEISKDLGIRRLIEWNRQFV